MTEIPIPKNPVELVHERPVAISERIRRITAKNPSHMTGKGTNTYLVGHENVAVIDPGPDDKTHSDAILESANGSIRWIFCTHTHPDHSPGTARLVKKTGAQVFAYSNRNGLKVTKQIRDGFRLETDEFTIRTVATPGHASNHLCYLVEEEQTLFSGDHIMQGSTVVISPPDGDMTAYFQSLEKVRALQPRFLAPGHGYVIDQPIAHIDWYLDHRREREEQLHGLLIELGSARVSQLVTAAYENLDPILVPMARRSVHAHLRKLRDEGKVEGENARAVWKPVR